MPLWALVPLILVAIVACPVSMWVMGKLMRRNVSCAMCLPGRGQHDHGEDVPQLEARKTAVEREIHAIETEMGRARARAGEPR